MTMTYDDFYYRKSIGDENVTKILDAKHSIVVDVNNIIKHTDK